MDLIHCNFKITNNGKGRLVIHMTKKGLTFFADTSVDELKSMVNELSQQNGYI